MNIFYIESHFSYITKAYLFDFFDFYGAYSICIFEYV